MGKKKGKGKGKKKKEIEPITDPEMLRILGVPLDGTALNVRLSYRELGHPLSFVCKMTDLACVHDMVRQFMALSNSPPDKQYIFVGNLRKSHQRTIMLPFDGGKCLTEHLGVMHGDEMTFIEADERMMTIYTRKRMQCHLEFLMSSRTKRTAEMIEAKRGLGTVPGIVPETITNLEALIEEITADIKVYREYAADPALAMQRLGSYRMPAGDGGGATNGDGGAAGAPPKARKPFDALPVEEQQRLKAVLTDGLGILKTNRDIAQKAAEKAAGGGKKKKKGKKVSALILCPLSLVSLASSKMLTITCLSTRLWLRVVSYLR